VAYKVICRIGNEWQELGYQPELFCLALDICNYFYKRYDEMRINYALLDNNPPYIFSINGVKIPHK